MADTQERASGHLYAVALCNSGCGCIRWPEADFLAPGRQSVKIQLPWILGGAKYGLLSEEQSSPVRAVEGNN